MSAAAFDAGLRLRAAHLGRAVASTARARTVINPDAVAIAVTAMAGEPDTIWAVAVGTRRRATSRPVSFVVGDPRSRAAQADVWTWMATQLLPVARHAYSHGSHPQIIVTSEHGWRLLQASAERFVNDDTRPDARDAARVVTWAAATRSLAGQQAVITATGLLGDHLAVGAEIDLGHLPALLAWADSTGPDGLEERLRIARAASDGTRTPDNMDRVALAAPVTDVANAHRAGKTHLAATKARAVARLLTPVVEQSWHQIWQAVNRFETLHLPTLTGVADMTDRDARSWHRFTDSRAAGYSVSTRPRPSANAIALTEAEASAEAWQALLTWDDTMARHRALFEGTVVTGVIDCYQPTGAVITVRSNQPQVRLRPGTHIAIHADVELAGEVVDLTVDGGDVTIAIALTTPAPPPPVGDTVWLVPPRPDFGANRARLSRVATVLRRPAWTHDRDRAAPAGRGRYGPADPLGAIGTLRHG